MRYLTCFLVICSVTLAGKASAQSVDQDVRCMVLSDAFVRASKVPAQKQLAAVTSLYFLGRITVRIPMSELKNRYLAQIKGLKNQPAGRLMNGCVEQLRAQERTMGAARQDIARSQRNK